MFDYLYRAAYDDCYTEPAEDAPEQTESAEPSETPTIDNANESSTATFASLAAEGSRARINAEIYALADKYQIEGLMKLSKQKLQSHLQSNWKYPEFIDTVRYVYGPDSPPHSELRDILSRSAIQHLSALQPQQQFHDIMRTFAAFSYDFSALMMEKVLQLEQKLW
ncbi:uncharacterized protein KD926_002127 [Aspergillus affinis]|uniref:uncharacterized protein n=1 Tax=Aspergillus affinis TaxID=1070780 RepID=UPI0022FEEEC5|nr:uncharacterized protein KD926_002127 [Aspergillus affinis]KAI9036262.1 hypothetical protein KD926_002127 [Aspergillus affinis]